jgi:hypothetical protein
LKTTGKYAINKISENLQYLKVRNHNPQTGNCFFGKQLLPINAVIIIRWQSFSINKMSPMFLYDAGSFN